MGAELGDFLAVVANQFAVNSAILRIALVAGLITSGAWALAHVLWPSGGSVIERAARDREEPPYAHFGSAKEAAGPPTLAEIEALLKKESRRGIVYGFVQNLFFFGLGTFTSVIAQGYLA